MAEFAQRRLEDFIPILEEIRRVKLFHPEKISEITSQLNNHELAIQKPTRSLDDVLRFVEYLLSILDSIQKHRKELQITEKKQEIDEQIKYKINSLFGQYERNFYDDLKFWSARVNFNIGQKWYDKTCQIYHELTKKLGKKHPFLWRHASEFEWTRNPLKFIDSARQFLQLGIRQDGNNLQLYLWSFELELKHANFLHTKIEKMAPNKEATKDQYEGDIDKCLAAADVLVNAAKSNCWEEGCTVKLFVLFHDVASKYPKLCTDLTAKLLKELEMNCSSDEETYHVLSLLALNQGDLNTALQKIDKGLEVLQTMKMYELAVNILVNYAIINPSFPVFKKLYDILCLGHKNDKLSCSCYNNWAVLHQLNKDYVDENNKKRRRTSSSPDDSRKIYFTGDDCLKMLNAGLNKYPHDADLTLSKAKFMMVYEDWSPSYMVTMLDAIKENGRDGLHQQIIEYVIQACAFNPKRRKFMEKMVIASMSYPRATKNAISYIKYMALRLGLDTDEKNQTRKAFEKIKNARRSNDDSFYDVYKLMADLEYCHVDHSSADKFGKVRQIMNEASILFGKRRIDVWVDFVVFEKKIGPSEKHSEIYSRAMTTLPEDLREKFVIAEKMAFNQTS